MSRPESKLSIVEELMRRLAIPLLAILVAYFATGVYQIGPNERGVVRRFGRVVARPGSGLWVGLPWGIDRVDRVPLRTWQLNVGTMPDESSNPLLPLVQLLTGDQNLVDVKLVLEYSADDRAGGLDSYVMHRDQIDQILSREVEALAAEWIASRTVDEVLLAGRASLPHWISHRLADRIAPYRLGVMIHRVSIEYLAAPREVYEDFQAVNQAQNAITTRENEARQTASLLMRDAEALKYRTEQEAEARRHELLTVAKVHAETFLKRLDQYQRLRKSNPKVLAAIWWEEMGRVLVGMKGRGRIDILDEHLGPNGLDVTQFIPARKK